MELKNTFKNLTLPFSEICISLLIFTSKLINNVNVIHEQIEQGVIIIPKEKN